MTMHNQPFGGFCCNVVADFLVGGRKTKCILALYKNTTSKQRLNINIVHIY